MLVKGFYVNVSPRYFDRIHYHDAAFLYESDFFGLNELNIVCVNP
ncbi:uncharacterized protein METZ01_LOCUS461479, partial [marine metagenome]